MRFVLNSLKKVLSWVAKRRWENKQEWVDLNKVNRKFRS